jgi:hypothetical protein
MNKFEAFTLFKSKASPVTCTDIGIWCGGWDAALLEAAKEKCPHCRAGDIPLEGPASMFWHRFMECESDCLAQEIHRLREGKP